MQSNQPPFGSGPGGPANHGQPAPGQPNQVAPQGGQYAHSGAPPQSHAQPGYGGAAGQAPGGAGTQGQQPNPYAPPNQGATPGGPPMVAPPLTGTGYSPAPPVNFKFAFVQNGNPHIMGKQGELNPHYLVLNNYPVSVGQIVDTDTRDQNLVIQVSHPHTLAHDLQALLAEGQFLIIQSRGLRARDLEMSIDQHASRYAAEMRRQQLAAEGRAGALQLMECPRCRSVVDLTEEQPSQYVFCRFCTTIFQPGANRAEADEYCTCDECGYFGRNQGYTEFYFYFLLIVYGFSSKRRHMCDNCAGSLFWKALLINLIFILGIAPAIWIKIKSISGRDPELADLPKANKLAESGRTQEAVALYRAMQQHYPNHPGLLFNEAQAYLASNDAQSAARSLEEALRACGTYTPAARTLVELQMLVAGAQQHPPQGY